MNIFELNTIIEICEKRYGKQDDLVKYYKAERRKIKKILAESMKKGFLEEAKNVYR